MNELTVANPFGDKRADAGGAMAQLERREEAEIMAMVAVAKRFPRDERAAAAKIGQVFERLRWPRNRCTATRAAARKCLT